MRAPFTNWARDSRLTAACRSASTATRPGLRRSADFQSWSATSSAATESTRDSARRRSAVAKRSGPSTTTYLAARGERRASHRDGRGAPPARRDDREYREYLSEEQRSRRGCIARRMQPDFHHGLLGGGASCNEQRGRRNLGENARAR